MACGNCQKESLVLPEIRLEYTTTVRYYDDKRGVRRDLKSCLVDAFGKPARGWSLEVVVNKQTVKACGTSPRSAVSAMKSLLVSNNITIPELDLWLNANIQWLSRSPEKFHLIPLDTVLSNSTVTPR